MAKKDVTKNVLDALKKGSKGQTQHHSKVDDVIKKNANAKGGPSKADYTKVKNGSAFKSDGGWDQASKTGSAMWGNLQNAAAHEGRTMLGMAGNHAIRGAAWGAVGGGSVEAMQGGSFWDGAKSGAVKGAVGWTGYRMGMKAVGAKGINPIGKDGLFNSGSNLYRSFSKDADVSGQAIAILNNRQIEGVARSVMNQRKAAKAKKD